MDKGKNHKGLSKSTYENNLYGPSFNFSDLVIRLNKFKASAMYKKSLFFKDTQNRLPLYRPFATFQSTAKANHTYKLSAKDLPSTLADDNATIKHRRQLSQKNENFELKPIRVETARRTRKEALNKRS